MKASLHGHLAELTQVGAETFDLNSQRHCIHICPAEAKKLELDD